MFCARRAVSTLVGYTQCVSSISIFCFICMHLCSMFGCTIFFCGKALNSIDIGGEGLALITTGGSDPVLRIWDPRKPGTSAIVFQFSSHSYWISACKWHNTSLLHLLLSSYDGKVMLWDLRTAILFCILYILTI
ncbi:hypothetical protein GOBAR_AA37673 [Gossypium barbadense]|uniref:Uncharacterized protein n=1 Tax=Gossypium barbadense TaxID=3634 RepID=A0A2P5VW62_GOSBA|nr:hypothetical protein GOBAR_AA37673 [Gossypium barbadense]